MKKTYKIDIKFYFSLIAFSKYIYSFREEKITKFVEKNCLLAAKKLKITDNYKSCKRINLSEIERLGNTVGSALFKKESNYYYANIYDLFQFITAYKSIKEEICRKRTAQYFSVSESVFQNLCSHGNLDKKQQFEKYFSDNDFDSFYFPKESKKLMWFIVHQQKRESV